MLLTFILQCVWFFLNEICYFSEWWLCKLGLFWPKLYKKKSSALKQLQRLNHGSLKNPSLRNDIWLPHCQCRVTAITKNIKKSELLYFKSEYQGGTISILMGRYIDNWNCQHGQTCLWSTEIELIFSSEV